MKTAPRILVLALGAMVLARAGAQTACYTITVAASAGGSGGCANLDVQTDGCGLVTATCDWFCICPYLPGAYHVVSRALVIGTQPANLSVPNVNGILAVIPDVILDLTPTAGHFGAILPPPPVLTGFTCFIQAGILTWGSGLCSYPFVWDTTDAFQISFL
jgi:hypothetical protein